MKKIFDPIHKYISFEPLLLNIIDTIEFQRLRDIKQLGVCYYVFSGASHNRFEHSLGVAYLCGKLLLFLKNNQPELNITDRDIILIKIAGLVHDIGHSCFSHFFDNYFLKEKSNSKFNNHEYRSQIIFEYIVEKYKLEISKEEINKIKLLIDPNENENNFMYQILANKNSSIDCDKFDYLLRDTYNLGLPYSLDCNRFIENTKVIDNNICFSDKLLYDIYDLLNLRFRLHKQIYNHHTVNQIEHMILDIFKLVDDELKISQNIANITEFLKLSDNILDYIYYLDSDSENIQKAKKIIYNIKTRNLYKLDNEFILQDKNISEDILKKYDYFKNNNYCKSINIINYTKGQHNPLDYIYLYDNNNKKYLYDSNKLKVYPNEFQEIILRIFKKI